MKRVARGNRYVGAETVLLALVVLAGCARAKRRVVCYAAHDAVYSEPILKLFTEKTGIAVDPVFDEEAAKSVGLAARLLVETDSPLADVFWNNEPLRTVALARRGVFESYRSPAREGLPESFMEPSGLWTGFAGRARVIIYNTDRVSPEEAPKSVKDLALPRWKGKVAVAQPAAGSTGTHVACLRAALGRDAFGRLMKAIALNVPRLSLGNATVRDEVAAGLFEVGLTDSDDALGAIEDGLPVGMVLPDQDSCGALLFPNTVALVRGAPRPNEAKALIDFLLSPQVERALARSRARQAPLRRGVEPPGWARGAKWAAPPWDAAAECMDAAAEEAARAFGG